MFSTDVPNSLPKAKAGAFSDGEKNYSLCSSLRALRLKVFFFSGVRPSNQKMRLCLTHLVGELDAHQFGAWRHLTVLPSALSWLSLFFSYYCFSFVFLKIMFFVFPHYCFLKFSSFVFLKIMFLFFLIIVF